MWRGGKDAGDGMSERETTGERNKSALKKTAEGGGGEGGAGGERGPDEDAAHVHAGGCAARGSNGALAAGSSSGRCGAGRLTAMGTGATTTTTTTTTTKSSREKKKSRLQWDEANLVENEKEVQRFPKMKIDEPKTPFNRAGTSDSESGTAGSSRDSEPPSPNALTWIDEQRLEGFKSLETQMKERGGSSSGSTPRSREDFERMRREHYHAEFPDTTAMDGDDEEDEEDDSENGDYETDKNIRYRQRLPNFHGRGDEETGAAPPARMNGNAEDNPKNGEAP